eukprot:CAMPEP_0201183802 /NCGR_PEP_ID=MMETSP0851-20130426/124577_1 /ASSEMBLY_ACC=CAM_ASM_000631 /TAXON_ID=183588 /ORGANISM="Pseudo-nitzschia fraudulenta, Strain WWA7" /LENGTH=62 /DNA_ID=CAMNT_0047468637 /DNA_START=127 /DNA_END=315 /DNA_ORIENTATION=+
MTDAATTDTANTNTNEAPWAVAVPRSLMSAGNQPILSTIPHNMTLTSPTHKISRKWQTKAAN